MKKMISDEWRTNFSKEEDLYIEVKSMCRKDEKMTGWIVPTGISRSIDIAAVKTQCSTQCSTPVWR